MRVVSIALLYAGQGHLQLSTQVLEQQDPSRPGSLAKKQPVPTSQALDRDPQKLWAKLSPRQAGYQAANTLDGKRSGKLSVTVTRVSPCSGVPCHAPLWAPGEQTQEKAAEAACLDTRVLHSIPDTDSGTHEQPQEASAISE